MKESVQVVEGWARLWSDPKATRTEFEVLFASKCRYEDVPFGEILQGPEETYDFHRRARHSFPDFTITLDSVIVDDEGAACATWSMSGTQTGDLPGLPATGRSVSMSGVSVLRIANDKITHCTDYYDAATMIRQLTDG